VIAAPGNYELTGNLGPCPMDAIDIEASNVQLKLNGYTITAGFAPLYAGISVNPSGVARLTGIQIQGPGEVTGFANGIYITNVDNVQVSKVTCAQNGAGLLGNLVTGLQLQQNVFARNVGDGLLVNSTNGMFKQNDISGNGLAGMTLLTGRGNHVENNTVDGNIGTGILIEDSGDQIQNNTANGNTFEGIILFDLFADVSGNQLQNNTAEGNGIDLWDTTACGANTWHNDIFFTSNPGSCIK